MHTQIRYRPVRFGAAAIQVGEAGGASYVSAVAGLGEYSLRTVDLLQHWAREAPERSFIARRDADGAWRHITYAQALHSARAIGQALLSRKLGRARPVAILSGNDLEHAMLALACQYVGVPYAPVSPAYSLASTDWGRLHHVIGLLEPGLVFAADWNGLAPAMSVCRGQDVEFVVHTGSCPAHGVTPFAALERSAPGPDVDAAMEATGPDTIVKFLFTSGSTRLPKAVINTNRMLCSNMRMLQQLWPFLAETPPVLVDWLPWHHTFGGNKNFNMVLFNGGTLYIDDGKPTAQGIVTTAANLREIAPTVYFNVPKGWDALANALENDRSLRDNFYRRLRLQFCAGAALSQPVLDRLHASAEAACGERIRMSTGLGMTETAPCALFAMHEQVRAGEVGVPAPGVELKLAPSGGKLELRYRGPNLTPGYWKAPGESAAMLDDEGFFCSGDAVKWLDPERPGLGLVFDGRLTEDFKLATGTWVSVGALRERVLSEGDPYVQDAVISGHGRSEVGLLIVPNLAQCRILSGLPASAGADDVLDSAEVRACFQALVNRLASQACGSASRIARALVLREPPAIERGELTDKGSINQRALLEQRAALVQLLHDGNHAEIVCAQDVGGLASSAASH